MSWNVDENSFMLLTFPHCYKNWVFKNESFKNHMRSLILKSDFKELKTSYSCSSSELSSRTTARAWRFWRSPVFVRAILKNIKNYFFENEKILAVLEKQSHINIDCFLWKKISSGQIYEMKNRCHFRYAFSTGISHLVFRHIFLDSL